MGNDAGLPPEVEGTGARVHETADVAEDVTLGEGAVVWHLAQVRNGGPHRPATAQSAAVRTSVPG